MKNNNKREEILENVQRVVVKVGTSTLTTEDGRLNIDKIKKIEYISSDIVNLELEIKIPELDSRNFSEDEMMRVVSKRFKEKTGKPIEILKTTPEKNIKPEWVSTLFKLMSDFTIEKVKTTKIFTYQNATISLKKVNKEWTFHRIVKQ